MQYALLQKWNGATLYAPLDLTPVQERSKKISPFNLAPRG